MSCLLQRCEKNQIFLEKIVKENAFDLNDNALDVLDESSRRIYTVHVQRSVVRRRKREREESLETVM